MRTERKTERTESLGGEYRPAKTVFCAVVFVLSISGCHAFWNGVARLVSFDGSGFLLKVCRDVCDFLVGVPLLFGTFETCLPERHAPVSVGLQYRLAFLYVFATALTVGVLHSALIFGTALCRHADAVGAIGTIAGLAALLCGFLVYAYFVNMECVRAIFSVFVLMRGEKTVRGAWKQARTMSAQNRRGVRTLAFDVTFVLLLCIPFLQIGLLFGIPFCVYRVTRYYLQCTEQTPKGVSSVFLNDPMKKE